MDLHYKVIGSINSPKHQVNLSVKMPGNLGCNGPIGFHTALMEKKRTLNFSNRSNVIRGKIDLVYCRCLFTGSSHCFHVAACLVPYSTLKKVSTKPRSKFSEPVCKKLFDEPT